MMSAITIPFFQEGARERRHPLLGATKQKQQVMESKGGSGEEGELNPEISWSVFGSYQSFISNTEN